MRTKKTANGNRRCKQQRGIAGHTPRRGQWQATKGSHRIETNAQQTRKRQSGNVSFDTKSKYTQNQAAGPGSDTKALTPEWDHMWGGGGRAER